MAALQGQRWDPLALARARLQDIENSVDEANDQRLALEAWEKSSEARERAVRHDELVPWVGRRAEINQMSADARTQIGSHDARSASLRTMSETIQSKLKLVQDSALDVNSREPIIKALRAAVNFIKIMSDYLNPDDVPEISDAADGHAIVQITRNVAEAFSPPNLEQARLLLAVCEEIDLGASDWTANEIFKCIELYYEQVQELQQTVATKTEEAGTAHAECERLNASLVSQADEFNTNRIAWQYHFDNMKRDLINHHHTLADEIEHDLQSRLKNQSEKAQEEKVNFETQIQQLEQDLKFMEGEVKRMRVRIDDIEVEKTDDNEAALSRIEQLRVEMETLRKEREGNANDLQQSTRNLHFATELVVALIPKAKEAKEASQQLKQHQDTLTQILQKDMPRMERNHKAEHVRLSKQLADSTLSQKNLVDENKRLVQSVTGLEIAKTNAERSTSERVQNLTSIYKTMLFGTVPWIDSISPYALARLEKGNAPVQGLELSILEFEPGAVKWSLSRTNTQQRQVHGREPNVLYKLWLLTCVKPEDSQRAAELIESAIELYILYGYPVEATSGWTLLAAAANLELYLNETQDGSSIYTILRIVELFVRLAPQLPSNSHRLKQILDVVKWHLDLFHDVPQLEADPLVWALYQWAEAVVESPVARHPSPVHRLLNATNASDVAILNGETPAWAKLSPEWDSRRLIRWKSTVHVVNPTMESIATYHVPEISNTFGELEKVHFHTDRIIAGKAMTEPPVRFITTLDTELWLMKIFERPEVDPMADATGEELAELTERMQIA